MAISEAKKKRVWENSGKRCTYCNHPLTYESMTLDHIVPLSAFKDDLKSQGHADDEDNLCVACSTCNSAKAAMSVKEFRKFVNTRNAELLKLEADYRKLLAQAEQLRIEMFGKRFDFIHYLRENFKKNPSLGKVNIQR